MSETRLISQRMLENGFNGFPRASRSIRARGPIGKKFVGGKNRSFEILASVAGKLLDKSSDAGASYVKDPYRTCDGNILSKNGDDDQARESSYREINSAPRNFNRSGMIDSGEKLETLDRKIAFNDYPCFPGVIVGKVQGVAKRKLEDELNRNRIVKDEIDIVTAISRDQKTLEVKLPELGSFFTHSSSNVQVVSRNDGKISFAAPPCTRDNRSNRISETDWIVTSDVKDEDHSGSDGKIEEIFYEKRTSYPDGKSQKIVPFKKRKFFNHGSFSASDQGFDKKIVFNSPENRINGKACAVGQQLSPNSKECNVKLSIKSFKVPELFIDVSTNATVGSLKRTVMEAVTSILGDGLHVGILVQGKKVSDDNKTLIQTGISQDDKRHDLGFVLEPKHSRSMISTSFKNKPVLSRAQSHGLTRQCRSLASQQRSSKASRLRSVESDLSAGETLADTSSHETNPDSKSLVLVPNISMNALAVVPFRRKSEHHEYGQRRIRRPFSVTEVEALVRAVEKIGTGRWRDVKFHAFDKAKHRTYVDLKDKWKTLVHTARISPQKRRGEPVPQELLDRVLAAQAYWSHRQAKQHVMLAV